MGHDRDRHIATEKKKGSGISPSTCGEAMKVNEKDSRSFALKEVMFATAWVSDGSYSTTLDMSQKPRQTAEMSPSH